jgi:pimeloyl-ACP methyl ester carboxylesterase
MPGYGFSGKPAATGWGPARVARAWAALMARLGYERYVAQGGDWGAILTDLMGANAPEGLIGIHTNMACVVPPEIDKVLWFGGPLPHGLSEDETRACEQLILAYQRLHYATYMGSRPQTLAALADSPVGLATHLLDLEPDARGLDLFCRVFDGKRESLTRDDVLDNATLYWLTNTGVSAARRTSSTSSRRRTSGCRWP